MNDTIERQRLFVMIGAPGSGKTTLAKDMIDNLGDNVVHISRDDINREFCGLKFNKRSIDMAYKHYIGKISTALKLGYDVIADSVNLSRSNREVYFALQEALKKTGFAEVDVIAVFLPTPLSKCIENNVSRDEADRVSETTIETAYSKIEEPSYDEGFKIILNKN